MKPEIYLTTDGSKTLYSKEFDEHYHSKNGAFTESQHIFINLGFKTIEKPEVNILEIGYGTGLNAIMTYKSNELNPKKVFYHGIEKFPISSETFKNMGYIEYFDLTSREIKIFSEDWDKPLKISQNFKLLKQNTDFIKFTPQRSYDLIYFDAFSPDTQPEMWTYENLKKILTKLSTDGVFVTYCSRGDLKRNLRTLGMNLKRFSGPPGKRHVIRASKH
ncbi:MAG: tRNA (5-methylaminomethyl-2-thiouridine)(34)-methyltransferase MnmD [Bacteroidales bacterium]|nr:tRNA (5-methylaminomethyl-2-thiouridine)(34)-methyltransferase MnmD [Bacteroidales bacterium]